MPYGPSYLQSRCRQIDVAFVRPASMGSSFLCLSTPGFDFAANPPCRMEFPDEPPNVPSLGRSATADVTRPPAVIKMTACVNLHRDRERG